MQRYPHGTVTLVVDCRELDRSARFWCDLLEYQPKGEAAGTYLSLVPTDGQGIELLLQKVPERKVVKNRLHLDLRVPDLGAEVERARHIGAQLITSEPITEDGWSWHVLADPDGNEFCVLQPPSTFQLSAP